MKANMTTSTKTSTNELLHINQEQMDGIVTAILSGKYSYACFLMLRAVGANALHYMPYRTYIRCAASEREEIISEDKKSDESTDKNSTRRSYREHGVPNSRFSNNGYYQQNTQ